MDIRDFEGNFKFKLYLPILYIINWALMIFGPFYFPLNYQTYYLCAMGYLAFRSVMTAIWTAIGCFRTHQLLNHKIELSSQMFAKNKLKKPLISRKEIKVKSQNSYLYAFIIPNYKEDMEVLQSTLSQLAEHQFAKKKYLIFLAMEDHQPNSEEKAQILKQSYKKKFRCMNYTIHTLRKYQQRGKAANVSWCAEHLEESFFAQEKIDPETVVLTIIDADSWVPEQYIEEIHQKVTKESLSNTIYQPCQMFIRNHMDVPAITRTYDISHGMVQFSNLFSLWNTSFPLSNYSLSFKLAKEIGFWDTCPDAIGEDFHTTIKAFTKTRGAIKTVSIFTPFNQLNIQTGRGSLSDISARFWQAQRHGRGCADAAYCLKQIFQKGISLRTFLLYYQVLEITTLPGILPWCMIGSSLLRVFHPQLVNVQLTGLVFNLCTLSFVFSFFMYFNACRRAAEVYYKQKYGQTWFIGAVQYIFFFIPNLFTITVPSATIAAFRVTFGNNIYTVAEKKASNPKIKQTTSPGVASTED